MREPKRCRGELPYKLADETADRALKLKSSFPTGKTKKGRFLIPKITRPFFIWISVMKMNSNEDWLRRKAKEEDGCIVSVGGLVTDLRKLPTFTFTMPGGEVVGVMERMLLFGYRGSIAHNMYVSKVDPQSIDDVDLLGFAFGSARHYLGFQEWGSGGTIEFWEGRYDCVWYELRKAMRLLLKGNPNIMSSLWLKSYLFLSNAGQELIENRDLFVGKHVYQSYAEYARDQLIKMEVREPAELREYLGITYALKIRNAHPTDQELPEELGDHTDCTGWTTDRLLTRYNRYIRKGDNLGYLGDKRKRLVLQHGFDSKNAAHAIRLLRMCKEFLLTGEMQVYRTGDVQELMDIKTGKWTLPEVKSLAEQLFVETKDAFEKSSLPVEPNADKAEKLLIRLIKENMK